MWTVLLRRLHSCHWAVLPFCHPAILPSCQMPFCRPAILQSCPICHSAVLPFYNPAPYAILPSCHSAVLPFYNPAPYAILPSCHSAVLPFCHPAICYSAILPSCHMPFTLLPSEHLAILPSCSSAILPSRYSAILSSCPTAQMTFFHFVNIPLLASYILPCYPAILLQSILSSSHPAWSLASLPSSLPNLPSAVTDFLPSYNFSSCHLVILSHWYCAIPIPCTILPSFYPVILLFCHLAFSYFVIQYWHSDISPILSSCHPIILPYFHLLSYRPAILLSHHPVL